MVAVLSEAGRGHVDDLATVSPIGRQLPALFQEDEFCQRFTSALDEVLAPVLVTLDCFDSYLDPLLAPDDFVDWLAGWVGVEVDENWPIERRRQLAVGAANLYRMRGTVAGLTEHVRLYCGLEPEIEESGGCAWSATAGGALPGSATPALTVRVRLPRGEEVNRSTVRRIVEDSRPAHLPCTVEVTGPAPRRGAVETGEESQE